MNKHTDDKKDKKIAQLEKENIALKKEVARLEMENQKLSQEFDDLDGERRLYRYCGV